MEEQQFSAQETVQNIVTKLVFHEWYFIVMACDVWTMKQKPSNCIIENARHCNADQNIL